MYNSLLIYRNELKNKAVSKYKMIGIFSELILSKKIFKKNSDIKVFLYDVLSVEYKEYIMKSRTSIMAHTIRKIADDKVEIQKKKLMEFISIKIEEIKDEDKVTDKKNDFNGWL